MSLDRAGAAALILGAIVYIALMAVHPSHVGPPVLGHLSLSGLVHGTALGVGPVLAFGYAVLAARLGLTRPLAALGLSFCLIGIVVVMLAGAMSGLVMPAIIQTAHGDGAAAAEAARDQIRAAVNYTIWLNRSFALVHYAMFSVAMMLWSIAWTERGAAGWIVRVLGIVIGAGVLVFLLSGHGNLEAGHGALAVTLGHMLWTLMAASLLLAPRKD